MLGLALSIWSRFSENVAPPTTPEFLYGDETMFLFGDESEFDYGF